MSVVYVHIQDNGIAEDAGLVQAYRKGGPNILGCIIKPPVGSLRDR